MYYQYHTIAYCKTSLHIIVTFCYTTAMKSKKLSDKIIIAWLAVLTIGLLSLIGWAVALQNNYHSAVDSLGKQVFDLQVQLNQKTQR